MSFSPRPVIAFAATCALSLAGCANPGPPKPPSLQVPAAIADLKAERHGNTVGLMFTLPQRTSDGLLLRTGQITARLCRAVEAGTCQPLPTKAASFAVASISNSSAELHDMLSGNLGAGAPRLLTYRVEMLSSSGRSAGYSNPAFAVAGSAPRVVESLRAEGSRLGIVLRWQPSDAGADVLLVREDLNAKPRSAAIPETPRKKKSKLDFGGTKNEKVAPAVVTLNASGETADHVSSRMRDVTLDTAAQPEVLYRYTAERRQTLELAGHRLELWSGPSSAITYTLHDSFPPPAPTALSVAGYNEPDAAQAKKPVYAADLIWEPVQDEQLAGYRVYRMELPIHGAPGQPPDATRGTLLTSAPLRMPAYHDTTANGSKRYRYSVTSVDTKGNESEAVTAVLEPQVF